jgi:hypothetical protein
VATTARNSIINTSHSLVDLAKPVKCLAFIQPGMEGEHGAFTAPQLIWKDCENDGTLAAGRVDLFRIKSLSKATVLDLRDFPLAMPGRSVMVKLQQRDETYVFEMRSERDTYRFTHGMRWVIARLSFNLIIGNLGVSCELLNVAEKDHQFNSEGLSLYEPEFPTTVGVEAKWTRAMNDVTCLMVSDHHSAAGGS